MISTLYTHPLTWDVDVNQLEIIRKKKDLDRFGFLLKKIFCYVLDNNKADLEFQYNNLFVGVTRSLIIPYASWYLTGSLNSEVLIDIKRITLKNNIELYGSMKQEPEDHLVNVMTIMGELIVNKKKDQGIFFQNYIQSWVHNMFQDVIKKGEKTLYQHASELGIEFVEQERKWYELSKNNCISD